MTYTSNCISLVKRFEGLVLTAYLCPAGIWTIGWGHTSGVKEGDVITEQMAEYYLTQDLDSVARELTAILPTTLNQNQFDALCSLCFNIGSNSLPIEAPTLWKDLKSGNFADASIQFLDIDHVLVDGKMQVLPGLRTRRIAEAQLFNTPLS